MNLKDKNSFLKNMLVYFLKPLTDNYLSEFNKRINNLCVKNNKFYPEDNSLVFKFLNKNYGSHSNQIRFVKKILHSSLIKEFNEINTFNIKQFEENFIVTLTNLLKNNKSYQILGNIPYDLFSYIFQYSNINDENDKQIFIKNWFNLNNVNCNFELNFKNKLEKENFYNKFIKNLYYFHSYNLLVN